MTTHQNSVPEATDSAMTPRQKTRLLMVNSTLHIGGAETVAACLAQHIDPRSFDVTACYLKEPGMTSIQMERAGVRVVPIPGLRVGHRDYLSFAKLRRLIAAFDTQLIHTHDIHGLIDGAACRLSMRGLRHVHTFHFGNYPYLSPRYRSIEAVLWRVPDAVVAVGHAQAAAIRDLYHVPQNRLHVIWNGVEEPEDRGDVVSLTGVVPPDMPIIASISTLIPQKGLDHLLNAAALLRQSGQRFVLLIAGEGPLREPLECQSNQLGLSDCVKFLGWVPQASDRLLPSCDIFVQSSLWEGMSVVVLEAMAAGKPMVVTTVGDNPHVVLSGTTGLTVPPADPEALAAALRTLLSDRNLQVQLGQAARLHYETHFTVGHMTSAYESTYRSVLGVTIGGTVDTN